MPLDSLEWQERHSPAMGLKDDAISKVVGKAVSEIDRKWKSLASEWKRVVGRASRGGFFGKPVSVEWLYQALFLPPSKWPSGLSGKQKSLVQLAVDISKYAPLYEDVKTDRQKGMAPASVDEIAPSTKEQKEAFERFASLFDKEIATPMFDFYRKTAINNSKEIMELCANLYPTPCSRREAVDIFFGDLERSWTAKTLDASPAMYRVFPSFVRYITQR